MKKHAPIKVERVLMEMTDESNYAVVTKKLGAGRFLVKLNLKKGEIIARLCGKFRKGASKKNNLVDIGTVVLVGLREFQNDAVDIVYVYNQDEARRLRKSGALVDEGDLVTDYKEEDGNAGTDQGFDFSDI